MQHIDSQPHGPQILFLLPLNHKDVGGINPSQRDRDVRRLGLHSYGMLWSIDW